MTARVVDAWTSPVWRHRYRLQVMGRIEIQPIWIMQDQCSEWISFELVIGAITNSRYDHLYRTWTSHGFWAQLVWSRFNSIIREVRWGKRNRSEMQLDAKRYGRNSNNGPWNCWRIQVADSEMVQLWMPIRQRNVKVRECAVRWLSWWVRLQHSSVKNGAESSSVATH